MYDIDTPSGACGTDRGVVVKKKVELFGVLVKLTEEDAKEITTFFWKRTVFVMGIG